MKKGLSDTHFGGWKELKEFKEEGKNKDRKTEGRPVLPTIAENSSVARTREGCAQKSIQDG